jgi:choline-sulfatase
MMFIVAMAALAAPDVVFITVDTLRADHLGCYGYTLPTSPVIDALSRDSLVFDDAVCEVPLTMPSFGAMLTGQYPRATGTTRNGLRLPPDVPLVAEQFQRAGYYTFCVQSNWTVKARLSGIHRGFDVYDDHFRKRRWGIIKSERDADEVARLAIDLLQKRDPEKPLFAWIHFSDPHAPYKYRRRFDPRADASRTSADDQDGGRRRKRVVRNYDSEIAFTDHYIGQVLDQLPEDAIVVFLSDHGESLYEHNYLGHGRRIYQTSMHIPLMIRAPGIAPSRSSIPVRGIDIGPTLLDLAGLPIPGSMRGIAILDPEFPAGRARVIETYGGAVPHIWGAKALMADKPPQLQGVLHEGWKLILNETSHELYHLVHDPMELQNRAAEEPARVAELEKMIRSWDSATTRVAGDEVELSDEDRRALDNLGYLE